MGHAFWLRRLWYESLIHLKLRLAPGRDEWRGVHAEIDSWVKDLENLAGDLLRLHDDLVAEVSRWEEHVNMHAVNAI